MTSRHTSLRLPALTLISKQRIGTWFGVAGRGGVIAGELETGGAGQPHHEISVGGSFALRMTGL